MNELRQAAEMALEALKKARPIPDSDENIYAQSKAMSALRFALAQPEQEPVEYKEECWACGCEECICATKVLGYYESKIKEAVLAEREACAKVCDERERPNLYGVRECATAIRARGEAEYGRGEKPPVKTYCGGRANYCTPEETFEVPCKTDPRAPHGFDRNASHNADRYVCECEGWEPVDAVNMSQDRVDETAKGEHEPFIYVREDTEMPFGGYEHCGQHEPGAFPVYLAPPKREWKCKNCGETND